MPTNIIDAIHYILCTQIDGPAADRFLHHVSPILALPGKFDKKYSHAVQIHWMATYWAYQLAALGQTEVHQLQTCSTLADFCRTFQMVVVPLLEENAGLPDISQPIYHLDSFVPHVVKINIPTVPGIQSYHGGHCTRRST